jgi:hypothetical protein
MRKRIGALLGCGEPSMRETVICHAGAPRLDGNTATNMAREWYGEDPEGTHGRPIGFRADDLSIRGRLAPAK